MNALSQDLRYAVRTLGKSPGFTLVAVATLALGIGANTAIFSVVRAVLLQRLPYPDPERLVVLREQHPHAGMMGVAWLNFLDVRARSRAFRDLAAFRTDQATLSGASDPELIRIAQVSASFFPMLGVAPALGRPFTEADDRPDAAPVILLANALWRDRFGADPSVVGRTLRLDAVPYTVAGVLPASFEFFPSRVDVYLPVGLSGAKKGWLSRGNHFGMRVLGRLAPGVTLEGARSDLDTIMRRLEREYPTTNSGLRSMASPLSDSLLGDVRAPLGILLGAVGLVLLIACANVAHLQLVRASGRQKEIAIRTAIGAGRWRIVRQLLTESLLLSALGGLLGLLTAIWALGPLVSLAPPDVPRLAQTRIDANALLFTLAVSMLTGTLFGLAPAFQASRSSPRQALSEGRTASSGPRRERLRSVLFVSEVTLAFLLAIGAGLLLRSLLIARDVPPGFRPEGLLALDVQLPEAKYGEGESRDRFFSAAVAELRRLPGVSSASAVLCPPTVGRCWGSVYILSDRPAPAQAELPSAAFNVADPDYFRAMGIPLRQGRLLDATDRADAQPVVVVNETMARRWWPNESPLGKRIKQGFPQDHSPFREIVGVVGNVRQHGLEGPIDPEVFLPQAQNPPDSMTLVVRTGSDPGALAGAATKAIRRVDPDQSVARVEPMADYLVEAVAGRRATTLLLGIFGALALGLASVGIFGVVSYGVAQRTHEIGIRTALGARPADVLRLVVAQALRLAAIGVALGAALALGASRLVASLLFGVGPSDPLTFAGVAALLTGVVLAACVAPARRALGVAPTVALRGE